MPLLPVVELPLPLRKRLACSASTYADLGWNDLGHFNGGLTRTKNIDELIAQGVLLERFACLFDAVL